MAGRHGPQGIHHPSRLAAVSQFEADHGPFTHDELSEAEQWAATAVQRASRTGRDTKRRTA